MTLEQLRYLYLDQPGKLEPQAGSEIDEERPEECLTIQAESQKHSGPPRLSPGAPRGDGT